MSGYRVITWQEKKEGIMLYSRKLAEIDYMLSVIDKHEIQTAKEFYRSKDYSELKTMLSKRLIDFAESAIYREYNVSKREEYKYHLKKIA